MSVETKNWQSCLQIASVSDVGMRRSNNQDHLGVSFVSSWPDWQERGHLLIVADGMGAHAAGELASEMAVEHVIHLYRKYKDKSPPDALVAAIEEANQIIHRRGESNTAFHRMGTTCSCLLLLPQGALVGQVGDSRVYRLRGNTLEQLSFDHSMAWEIRAATANLDDSSELYDAIPKNVITRSLGPNEKVEVDIEGPFPFEVGDTFLLCSDGASGPISDDEIALILQSLEPHHAAQLIVDLANLRGGPDNITAIVAKVTAESFTNDPTRNRPVVLEDSVTKELPKVTESKVHPAFFGLLTICLISSLGLAAFQFYLAALITAGVFLLGAAFLFLYKLSDKEPVVASETARSRIRLGKAPYVRVDCNASPEVIQNLRSIISELKETAAEQKWNLKWENINPICDKADASLRQKNYKETARFLLIAVGMIMAGIRTKQSDPTKESPDPEK